MWVAIDPVTKLLLTIAVRDRSLAMAAGLTDHVWAWREVPLFRGPPWPQPQAVYATDEEKHPKAERARCARRQAKRAASDPGTPIEVLMTG
jgi:hypothetical protein